jgi:lipoyl(octanoyl) transferase
LSASAGVASPSIRVRDLGRRDYAPVYAEMRAFTEARTPDCADELWLVEHPPVFTQGQAGKPEHLLMPGDIPVVATNRGGQVTYHGPGQAVVYVLVDMARRGQGIRALVTRLEQAMIDVLAGYGIAAAARADAPGVYVDGRKIGSLGLRVSRGCSYHGLSLNVAMDLEPFGRINPCGLVGMAMTQLADLLPPEAAPPTVGAVQQALAEALIAQLNG